MSHTTTPCSSDSDSDAAIPSLQVGRRSRKTKTEKKPTVSEKRKDKTTRPNPEPRTRKNRIKKMDDDAISISTSDILSVDHTFFVLSQFFMTQSQDIDTNRKNVTTILSEINEKLGKLISVIQSK